MNDGVIESAVADVSSLSLDQLRDSSDGALCVGLKRLLLEFEPPALLGVGNQSPDCMRRPESGLDGVGQQA